MTFCYLLIREVLVGSAMSLRHTKNATRVDEQVNRKLEQLNHALSTGMCTSKIPRAGFCPPPTNRVATHAPYYTRQLPTATNATGVGGGSMVPGAPNYPAVAPGGGGGGVPAPYRPGGVDMPRAPAEPKGPGLVEKAGLPGALYTVVDMPYADDGVTYTGEVVDGDPHGYGTMSIVMFPYKSVVGNRDSVTVVHTGMWNRGDLMDGYGKRETTENFDRAANDYKNEYSNDPLVWHWSDSSLPVRCYVHTVVTGQFVKRELDRFGDFTTEKTIHSRPLDGFSRRLNHGPKHHWTTYRSYYSVYKGEDGKRHQSIDVGHPGHPQINGTGVVDDADWLRIFQREESNFADADSSRIRQRDFLEGGKGRHHRADHPAFQKFGDLVIDPFSPSGWKNEWLTEWLKPGFIGEFGLDEVLIQIPKPWYFDDRLNGYRRINEFQSSFTEVRLYLTKDDVGYIEVDGVKFAAPEALDAIGRGFVGALLWWSRFTGDEFEYLSGFWPWYVFMVIYSMAYELIENNNPDPDYMFPPRMNAEEKKAELNRIASWKRQLQDEWTCAEESALYARLRKEFAEARKTNTPYHVVLARLKKEFAEARAYLPPSPLAPRPSSSPHRRLCTRSAEGGAMNARLNKEFAEARETNTPLHVVLARVTKEFAEAREAGANLPPSPLAPRPSSSPPRRLVTRSMTRGGTSAAFSMLSIDAIVDKHLADCKNY